MISPIRASFSKVLLAAGVLALAGCSGSSQGAQGPNGPGFPRWEARAKQVFDDNLDRSAVGMQLEADSPRNDKFLRERAQTADLVARLRVQTVTVDSVGEESRYHLGMQVGYPTLGKPKMEDRTVELEVRSTSPAYEVVKGLDARLRGMTFIGFVSRFQSPEGDPEVHFHLSADTAEVAAAVQEALALQELTGS
jgi:hypothetical protein